MVDSFACIFQAPKKTQRWLKTKKLRDRTSSEEAVIFREWNLERHLHRMRFHRNSRHNHGLRNWPRLSPLPALGAWVPKSPHLSEVMTRESHFAMLCLVFSISKMEKYRPTQTFKSALMFKEMKSTKRMVNIVWVD